MTGEPRVEVEGFPELARDSRRLFAKIERGAPAAFAPVAARAAASGRARVPRRSGALAGSVTAGVVREGAQVGYSGVAYSGWIEFGGTRSRPYVPAGRYLFPVAMEVEPQLEAAGVGAAKNEIGGFRWSKP